MLSYRILLAPKLMHIPDGFLSLSISLACWLITAAILMVAIRRSKNELGERQVPLMGVMAAFIFAAQMLNFPVAGGTSGHLLGGALAAIALGPWASMLVMSSVIIVQGLLFQDGGLLVMGANILNMGLLTVVVGYGIYRISAGRSRTFRLATAGAAAWLSVMTGALATSLELWLSGTAQVNIVVPAMLAVHALIGIGEALITVAALAFILRTRPDIIEAEGAETKGGRGWIAAGALIVLAALLLSPMASANPDGLNRVALNMGFSHVEAPKAFTLIPLYVIPFIGPTPVSKILAGVIGALIVVGVILLLVRLLKTNRSSNTQ